MISVIAKIPVKEEKRDEAIEAFKQLVAEVAKEEGTLSYTLNVSKNEPNVLVVMERYKDKEALKTHSSTPHFQSFFAKAGELFSGSPEITILSELASI
jgi:quinol monooxygenase YgiN